MRRIAASCIALSAAVGGCDLVSTDPPGGDVVELRARLAAATDRDPSPYQATGTWVGVIERVVPR